MRPLPFTTLRIENGAPWFWEDHVARLRETTAALGYRLPEPVDLYSALPRAVGGTLKVRLTVQPDGQVQREVEPYEPPAAPWTLRPVPVEPDSDFVRFKTTARVWYDAARELLAGEDDALLFHSSGHDMDNPLVLETTIANLFFEIDGEVLTPARSAPLLPGIARTRILAAPFPARETVLRQSDVVRATACCATNAVFGAHPVATVSGWNSFESDGLARELMGRLRSSMQESV